MRSFVPGSTPWPWPWHHTVPRSFDVVVVDVGNGDQIVLLRMLFMESLDKTN